MIPESRYRLNRNVRLIVETCLFRKQSQSVRDRCVQELYRDLVTVSESMMTPQEKWAFAFSKLAIERMNPQLMMVDRDRMYGQLCLAGSDLEVVYGTREHIDLALNMFRTERPEIYHAPWDEIDEENRILYDEYIPTIDDLDCYNMDDSTYGLSFDAGDTEGIPF